MENTAGHPAPRQRSVRHRVARALTPARRETGAGGGGDGAERGRPTDRRGRTATRVPGGCDHALTTPGALAVARARHPRDPRVSRWPSRRGRASRQTTATPRASGAHASPPGDRRRGPLGRGRHARAPRQQPRPGARQPQRQEQLAEQRQRRHRRHVVVLDGEGEGLGGQCRVRALGVDDDGLAVVGLRVVSDP